MARLRGVLLRFLPALLALTIICFASDDDGREPTQRTDAPFRLFRTQNMYMFLKLDTRTGQIWEVQWSAKDENRFEELTSAWWLVPGHPVFKDSAHASETPEQYMARYTIGLGKLKPGRFTLYPTSNIFNFLLLDQDEGSTWQVQWSHQPENRLVMPIESGTTKRSVKSPSTAPWEPVTVKPKQ